MEAEPPSPALAKHVRAIVATKRARPTAGADSSMLASRKPGITPPTSQLVHTVDQGLWVVPQD
jgi:hypothetical protein